MYNMLLTVYFSIGLHRTCIEVSVKNMQKDMSVLC